MEARVDGERCLVDGVVTLENLPGMADQQEVRDPDVAERRAKRVDPEAVAVLGIPDGDVAGHALAESEASEDAKGSG